MSTVTGPISSTDTAIARWNGTTGSVIQDSTVTIDGTGNVGGVASLAGSVTTTTQSQGDNSTNIATTAYVDTGLAGLSLNSLSDVIVTARQSIYLGAGDGVSDAFGLHNISLGEGALASVINADNLIAIGPLALASATGGTNNIALGWSALTTTTGSQGNIAIGTLALSNFTHGPGSLEYNMSVGHESLIALTTGVHNISIGALSGGTLVTGDNNILIGVNADVPTSTTSNYININGVITGDGATLNIAGSPTTTTQSPGDNSDNIATTSYVDNAVYTTDVPVSAVSVMSSTPLPSCTYDNGPDSDGVGATLMATSNGALVIDGMSFSGGERVGIQDEAAAETNGIYDVSSPGDPSDPWVLTRSADFDDPAIISSELPFCVLGGNTYPGSVWCLSSPVGTIGTDPIILSQMSYSTPFTLGNSLTSAHIFVGNAAGVATDVAMTGDISVNNAGVTSIKTNVALAGSPTTTTQSAHDNSTKIATTAYVDTAVSLASIVLTGYMAGCLVTNNATTPNTKVDIAAGIAANSTGTTYIMSAGYTVDFSSSGAVNKLDTGTIAASTWYHVFVIAKADGTTGGLASLSATAPTLPSGYTVFRRVGSVLTNSSAHILGFKAAYTGGGTTEMFWNASVLDISTTTLGASSTTYTLSSVPTGIICQAILQYDLFTANIICLRSLDQPDEVPSGSLPPIYTIGSSGGGANQGGGHNRLRTNTSAQIAMRSNAASTEVKAATLGWVDFRGT